MHHEVRFVEMISRVRAMKREPHTLAALFYALPPPFGLCDSSATPQLRNAFVVCRRRVRRIRSVMNTPVQLYITHHAPLRECLRVLREMPDNVGNVTLPLAIGARFDTGRRVEAK